MVGISAERAPAVVLDPAKWLALVAPAAKLDGRIAGGLTLYDVRWTDDRDGLLVELTAIGCQDGIEVALGPGRAPGTMLGSVVRTPPQHAAAADTAVRALAAMTQHGLQGRSATVRRPTGEDPLDPIEGAPSWPERAAVPDSPERDVLELDRRNYAVAFGAHPVVHERAGGSLSVRYPPPTRPIPTGAIHPLPHVLTHTRRYRAYLRELGFALDPDGRARTVPTPTSFATALRERGIASGVTPSLERIDVPSQPALKWLWHLLEGNLRISVTRAIFARVHRALPGRWASRVAIDVGLLAHDMSLHVLAFHRAPPQTWRAITAPARALLRRHPTRAIRILPGRLEGALTRAFWDLWIAAGSPAAFDAHLARRADALALSLVE